MPDVTRQRLRNLVALLRTHPDGLSVVEIATELGVSRRTVYNDRDRLTLDGIPIYEENNRLVLDSHYQAELQLSLAQAWFMYLPLRRIVRADLHRFPLVRSLLYRVASLFQEEIADQLVPGLTEPESTDRDQVFAELVYCWHEQRHVELRYRRPNADHETQLVIAPWWFEPAVWSDAFYLIGGLYQPDGRHTPITLKIDRIQSAQALSTRFERPSGQEITEYLEKTWGIWVGEDEPVLVKLRFHNRLHQRLKETRWHPTQAMYVDGDGSIIWQARVSEPQEMLPWIRGWGADVEVLEPISLRQQLIREARKLAQLYKMADFQSLQPKDALWAKYDSTTGQAHLLLYHLIDVAEVALIMWEEVLSLGFKRQFAEWLDLDVPEAGRLLAFWAGLHDIGKASPVFQHKNPDVVHVLEDLGLTFPSLNLDYVPHGLISTYSLTHLLENEMGLPPVLAEQVAWALGGHHGVWPSVTEMGRPKNFTVENVGNEYWAEARQQLLSELEKVITPPREFSFDLDPEQMNALLILLSGFTSVVDWVGSMEEYFPYQAIVLPAHDYAATSHEQARVAITRLGWIGWHSTGDIRSFLDLFPDFDSPNAVQQEVIDSASDVNLPALVILEAPTGIGKTEAALYLADHWLQQAYGGGLYVAMPTQATSNQMFGRVLEFLRIRYPHDLVNYHLLHGQAQWMEAAQQIRLTNVDEGYEGTVAAMSWFLPRKRSLLAPFAVGTVDQTLMSILLTKHFFVRLFGLGHKVIIFDEVHAYDTYMSTLFRRLLEWLRHLNTSVIILSATLPETTRAKLIQSYNGDSVSHADKTRSAEYPRLTVADRYHTREISLTPPASKQIALEWIPRSPDLLAETVARELAEGGCAVIICNTVQRAQDVFRALQSIQTIDPNHLWLFHAQFPFVRRESIEQQVLNAFGKKGNRPKQAVLVATQVVEQSLDLDFDLMITDLAPIDLLLQRAGRLHRHAHPIRPARLAQPRLLITEPGLNDGIPDFDRDVYVYEEFILIASMLALGDKTALLLPDDTTQLIEFVYGDTPWLAECPETLRVYLQQTQAAMQARFREERQQARGRIVLSPDAENLLTQTNPELEEDNPEVHQVFQAMTRLIEPGVSIVCLYQTGDRIALEPDGTGLIDPYAHLTRDQEKLLLQRTVTVRHKGVLSALIAQQPPNFWQTISSLRHHRLVVFNKGHYQVPGTPFVLRLSRTYGLEIRKENE